MVTWPLDAVVILIFWPATKYDVPSVSLVKEPDKPELNLTAPVKARGLISVGIDNTGKTQFNTATATETYLWSGVGVSGFYE